MKAANSVLSGYGTTIFEVMSRLAQEHESVNLGQGFPDGNGPPDVVAAATDYLENGVNQYPSMMGIPPLREAVAEHAKRFYDLDVDWPREVLVTSGGTEALGAALFGLIEPGDEAVLIEPLYDSYLPIVRRAGAIPRTIRLEPPDWALPVDEAARGVFGKDQADPVQHADESLRQGVHARGARSDRRTLHRTRRLCGVRRGLRASGLRRQTPYPDDHAARHARARGQDRLGGQDFLPHRLEGRHGHGGARPPDPERQGAPVPDLHHAPQLAERSGLRAAQGRFLFRWAQRRHAGASRFPGRGPRRNRLRDRALRRDLFPDHRFSARSVSTATMSISAATSPSRLG